MSTSTINPIFKRDSLGGAISAQSTVTLTPILDQRVHLLILGRNNTHECIIVYDYWSDSYSVLGGALSSHTIITKNANSDSITVESQHSYMIGYLLL